MNRLGLFGGGWEDYQDALNDAFDQHAAANWPPSPFGASADAILAAMPDPGAEIPAAAPDFYAVADDGDGNSFASAGDNSLIDQAERPVTAAQVQVGAVPFKPDTNPPSAEIGGMVQCIQQSCPGLIKMVTSTSEKHGPTDPHTRGLAADVTTSDPQTLMQCAAECGAAYQQDEYSHPSPNSTAPHVHLQLVPGKGGATGPYYPLPRPTPRPDR